ncbi:angiopoietin-related protein 7-like [Pelobates fuscus]|uniref:angiopoietin-related protein 7-like n=1 Tax=Pelobates fuscus TaxID=191477 RepID=UPI002FE4C1F6
MIRVLAGLTSFNAIDISESRHHQTDGHIDLSIQNFKRKLREHIPVCTSLCTSSSRLYFKANCFLSALSLRYMTMPSFNLFGYFILFGLYFNCFSALTVTDDPIISGYDCSDIWLRNQSSVSGVYIIKPIGATNSFEAFCEMKADGGLSLIQSHNGNDQLPFDTDWNDYKEGFGTLTGEHWLGLEKMYLLTHQGSRAADLLITLGDFDKSEASALYSPFTIGSEDTQYKISLGNYSGNAGTGSDDFCNSFFVNTVRRIH